MRDGSLSVTVYDLYVESQEPAVASILVFLLFIGSTSA